MRPSRPRLDTGILLKAFDNCVPTSSGETYVGSAIPAAKLSNALAAYAPELTASDVLLLHDSTFFGGAKDGFLLTSKAIFWHNIGERRGTLQLHEVTSVEGLGIGVRVNGSLIMISDAVACQALIRLLKRFARRRP